MRTFVPRLVALTVVWLLATAALTYAAAQKISTPSTTPAATTSAAAPPALLTVPDVRRQAYTFAKGTLSDAGFAWKVTGSVRGYASNTVAAQTPAPGTQVVDTGAPTIVLRLVRSGAQLGIPERGSDVAGTRIRLAALASNEVKVPAHAVKKAVAKKTVVKHTVVKHTVVKHAMKKAAPVVQGEAEGRRQEAHRPRRRQAPARVRRPGRAARAARRAAADRARERSPDVARAPSEGDRRERQALALPARVDRRRRPHGVVARSLRAEDPDRRR